MIIKSIHLCNFRNHTEYSLCFDTPTSLILGTNGWGKTSILEAIYILTRGKSFRATDPSIIKHDTAFYSIKLEYYNGETISATFDGTTKYFNVQDKKSKRLSPKNKYPVVLFLPQDLNLISASPARRREYFDNIFGILSEQHGSNLSRYQKVLRQRGELLKNPNVSRADLFTWNLLLARYGVNIMKARAKFLREINSSLSPTYHSIAVNTDELSVCYKSDALNLSEQQYLDTLERNFDRDRYLGHTSFGIHRDDYIFNFNHYLADDSASRGETRSIILSLKFIEATLYQKYLNKQPIILLDDVFSELDDARRECLIKNFSDHQIILTSVEDIEDIKYNK